jgi:murein DD-endopeptidase MepM/ murein hydrolase activator NlpD
VQQGKGRILSQIKASQERKLRLRWLLAVSSIPLFGVITAFGIAPQTAVQNIPVELVVEELTLPGDSVVAALTLDQQPLWQADEVRKDDTLSTILDRLNIRNTEAIDFLRQSPDASALAAKLRPGRPILAKITGDGKLLELQYQYDWDAALQVKLNNDAYVAEQVQLAQENRTELKSAEIRSSLFAATDAAGIPDAVAMQLVQIFSSDIDFHLDLREGDRFTVIYEAGYSKGEMTTPGKVLAAEFVNQGKTYSALLYRDSNGRSDYFTPEGKALHKAFLRSPLEFSRISSGFTLARFHPVLKRWRAHKGVDYAAPIGTRIKATADGTVAFAGQQGGYGNVVMLQHTGGVTTVYGHLSRFAAGLRKGQRISQGDVIGHVGMSGLASGPHLHYEFRVHGQHRDPLKVALPNTATLTNINQAAFKTQAQPLLAQLALLRSTQTASLER